MSILLHEKHSRMGDDGDRRSLLWSPSEILSDSDSSETINTNGKQGDTRIQINSAVPSEPETIAREDLTSLWTPDSSLLVPDDRHRRSSLWDSAVVTNSTSRDETREESRAGKRIAEIESTDSDIESRRLLDDDDRAVLHSNGIQKFEIEEPGRARNEIKEWVRRADQRQSSMAERLSNLLRIDPSASVVDDAGGDATARERRRFSDPGRGSGRRIAQLTRPSLQRRNSLAMQVSDRVPPEWVLLLLGCLLGLFSGISVVLFNKGVGVSAASYL